MLTCIHQTEGLCPACKADYDADPSSWLEYGDHPQGLANAKALADEMEAALATPPAPPWNDPEIPF